MSRHFFLKINKHKEKYEDLVMSFLSLNLQVNRTRERQMMMMGKGNVQNTFKYRIVDHIIVSIKRREEKSR